MKIALALLLFTGSALADSTQGWAAVRQQDYATAERHFKASAESGQTDAYHYLGLVSERQGHTQAAITYYTLAARHGITSSVDALRRLGADVPVSDVWYGRPAPTPPVTPAPVARSSGAGDALGALGLMLLLQQQRPMPFMQPPIHCNSFRYGSNTTTTCN